MSNEPYVIKKEQAAVCEEPRVCPEAEHAAPLADPVGAGEILPEKPAAVDLKAAKKHFSRLGLAVFVILFAGSIVQGVALGLVSALWPQWLEHSWGMWLLTFAPLYLAAVPLGLLLLRKVPVKPLAKQSLRPGQFLTVAIISIFMMYAGNILGTVITTLLQLFFGVPAGNPVMAFATDNAVLPKVLFMVILAPVIEEYIFRKQLIDRMHTYGEKLAVVTSALLFGLFHGNLSQLFYAFSLGLVFGYVYLKTGKLRYTIGLHMFINFMGSVLAPTFLEKIAVLDTTQVLDMQALIPILPWLLGFAAYGLLLFGLSIAGLVLLCVNRKKITFAPAEQELPKAGRIRTVYGNTGMLLFIIGCALTILASLFLV